MPFGYQVAQIVHNVEADLNAAASKPTDHNVHDQVHGTFLARLFGISRTKIRAAIANPALKAGSADKAARLMPHHLDHVAAGPDLVEPEAVEPAPVPHVERIAA